MQMALYNNVPVTHPLFLFLGPQSNFLIPFDDALIVLWQYIAPPTSISTAFQFLTLANQFAVGRGFFDDDPPPSLLQSRYGATWQTRTMRVPVVTGSASATSARRRARLEQVPDDRYTQKICDASRTAPSSTMIRHGSSRSRSSRSALLSVWGYGDWCRSISRRT